MKAPRSLVSLACAAALLAGAAREARANGRFPQSNQIVFSDADPNLVLLRVTFGVLLSHDRGETWDWVCEPSIGSSGVEDPMYTVTPTGAIVATTFQGLTSTRDGACTWSFAGGALDKVVFIDLAARPKNKANIVAFASSYDHQDEAGAVLFKSQLYVTDDGAQTFRPLGAPLDPGLLGETVDLTATDDQRIYVSAVENPGTGPAAYLLTSRDAAKTWEKNAIALINNERAAYIAAVDPTNADRVYVRTRIAGDKPSRVLVSDDAGKTWKVVFQGQGPLPGFALSPDGAKIYLGGPLDGVRVASTTDFAFTQTSTKEIQCLAVASDGLWACSNEKSGFVAGLSKDDGATFEAKLHFCDIRGALACPAGTPTHDQCVAAWPQQSATLGCEGIDAGADAGDAGPSAPPDDDGGCACDTTGAAPPSVLAGLVVGALAFMRRRRTGARR